MDIFDMRDTREQPPPVQELIGLRVIGAWLFEDGHELMFMLEGGLFVNIQRVAAVGGIGALVVNTGKSKPDADWSWLPDSRSPHCRELRGKRFNGLDGPMVIFENVGAHLTLEGVIWKRKSE